MIIKYDEDSFLDIDSITAIVGQYGSAQEERWCTKFIVGGASCTVYGKAGKAIIDAYKWKNKHAVYDMIVDSPNYKQQIKGEL